MRAGESATLGSPPLLKRHSTPIHLLPEEIFLEVVRLCISPDMPLRNRIALTWVCRRWKTILEGAASFWSRISAADGFPCIQKALHLAKGVPLDLVYSDKGHGVSRGTFFNEVGDRIAQWRSLVAEFDGWSTPSPLANLGTIAAPKLVFLQLVNTMVTGNSTIPITLFGGAPAPPSLKNLHITLIPVSVAPLHLSGLKSLTLQGVQTVSTTDILRILVDSPEIQTLHLASLWSLDRPKPQTLHSESAPTLIRLSALCELLLEDVPPSVTRYLLSIINTPNLHTLKLICDDSGRMASEILTQDTFHLIPVLATMTTDAQEIDVSLSGYYHYHILVGRLVLGGWMEDPPTNHVRSTVDWICNHLNNHLKNLPVHLSITDSDPEIDYLDSFSSGLRVAKLTLWSVPYHGLRLEKFIPLLSQPTLSSPCGWILPHLEVIDANLIEGEGNYDFVDLVRNRYSASIVHGESEPGSEVVAPRPFRELYLSSSLESPSRYASRISAFMQALHEAGNGIDLYWHGTKWIEG